MKTDDNFFIRVGVIAAASVATAGMALISMRTNYYFGYGFGQTPENAQIFGWANVAVDLWKASGLVIIVALWKARRFAISAGLVPLWAICVLWGMLGALGVYAQDRTALIGGREATVASYKDTEIELAETERKLKDLATHRSVAEVEAAIAAVFARPIMIGERVRGTVGKISNSCTREDRASAQSCLEVAQLRGELAVVSEAAKLEAQQRAVRDQLKKLRERGGSREADPVGALFAWLTRGQLSVRDVQLGMPLVFAILIEMVSAFGPIGIVAYAGSGGPLRVDKGTGEKVDEGGGEEAHVAKYVHDRIEPAAGAVALDAETLHGDYETWCVRYRIDALSFKKFVIAFDRLRATPALRGTTGSSERAGTMASSWWTAMWRGCR